MSHRSRVLGLYRALLREARLMPTENRRLFVARKARADFTAGRGLPPGEERDLAVALAETQLDNVSRQRQLLNELDAQGNLKGPR